MLGQACAFRNSQHMIVHPELEGWLRREIPDHRARESLFVYYHRQTGNYVIAEWISPRRYFQDVLNIGPSLGLFTNAVAHRFKQLYRQPTSGRELAKQMRQHELHRLKALQDENDET